MWFRLSDRVRRVWLAAYWAAHRTERRLAWRLIEWLIVRYRYHNTVLDTAVPNVPFLRVKSLVVTNGYGQEHVIRA
jgi:hypothetical protein